MNLDQYNLRNATYSNAPFEDKINVSNKYGRKCILMIMQSNTDSAFDLLFKEHFSVLYEDSDKNRSCRLVLVDILKYCMVGEWLPKFMIEYKDEVFTFNDSQVDSTEVTCPVPVLNDDNLNPIFGWDLINMK